MISTYEFDLYLTTLKFKLLDKVYTRGTPKLKHAFTLEAMEVDMIRSNGNSHDNKLIRM